MVERWLILQGEFLDHVRRILTDFWVQGGLNLPGGILGGGATWVLCFLVEYLDD